MVTGHASHEATWIMDHFQKCQVNTSFTSQIFPCVLWIWQINSTSSVSLKIWIIHFGKTQQFYLMCPPSCTYKRIFFEVFKIDIIKLKVHVLSIKYFELLNQFLFIIISIGWFNRFISNTSIYICSFSLIKKYMNQVVYEPCLYNSTHSKLLTFNLINIIKNSLLFGGIFRYKWV